MQLEITERDEAGKAVEIKAGFYLWQRTSPYRWETQNHSTGAIYAYSVGSGQTIESTDVGSEADRLDAHESAVAAIANHPSPAAHGRGSDCRLTVS